ncbi:unnamed protein product [Tilletia laevis]|nr:unnamed protein product [Tilletia laevis]
MSWRGTSSNPEARKNMSLYPRLDGTIKDAMDGDWVHNLRDERASPMIVLEDGRHAYREEPVQLLDGRYYLITAWYEKASRLYGWGKRCVPNQRCKTLKLSGEEEISFPALDIDRNGPGVAQQGYSKVSRDREGDEDEEKFNSICPLRKRANGRPMYSIFLKVFLDDLSGVRSKRWDIHHGLYFQNANMSKSHLSSDASIKLFSATPSASAGEMMEVFLEELCDLREGFECLDQSTNAKILVRPTLAVVICDNPMAAELVGIVGMRGNCPCRACRVGGTLAEKKTEDGLLALMQPGDVRTSGSIKANLLRQINKSARGMVTATADIIPATGCSDPWTTSACLELQDAHAESREAKGTISREVKAEMEEIISEKPWPALLDYPSKSHIVSRLCRWKFYHVVQLGVVKYLTRATMDKLSEKEKIKLGGLLSAADVDGLGLDAKVRGGYCIRHAQSLNGKDFRALLQTMPTISATLFASGDNEEDIQLLLDAWLAAARLAAALYIESIDRSQLESFTDHVREMVKHFFHSLSLALPELIPNKPKLHLLIHVDAHLKAFGPLSALSAEHFEAFNSIVRAACVVSNRQIPSRDIANRLTSQQDLRHILSGGRLAAGEQAGWDLRIFLESKAGQLLLKMFGVRTKKHTREEGAVELLKGATFHEGFLAKNNRAGKWRRGGGADLTDLDRSRTYIRVKSFVAHGSNDIVQPGSCVLVKTSIKRTEPRRTDATASSTDLFLVENIFHTQGPTKSVILEGTPLWKTLKQDQDDDLLHMECGPEEEDVLIDGVMVTAIVNVQHDCIRARCKLRRTRAAPNQKRTHLGVTLDIKHSKLGIYKTSHAQLRSGHILWRHIDVDEDLQLQDIAKTTSNALKEKAEEKKQAQKGKKRKRGASGT